MIWFLPFLEQNTHLRVLTGFSGAGRLLVEDLAMCISLSGIADQLKSEGGFVVAAAERTRRGSTAPRVVLLGVGTAGRSGRTGTPAAATAEPTAAAAAAGFVHL